MVDKPAKPLPQNSGYPEQPPKTNQKGGKPDAGTPHEPQNVPDKKPKS
jgi:hypothetical protein